jgi:hypothetical protein
MEFQKSASCGKVSRLYFVELLSQAAPLAFVHGRAAEYKMMGATRCCSTVARFVDV